MGFGHDAAGGCGGSEVEQASGKGIGHQASGNSQRGLGTGERPTCVVGGVFGCLLDMRPEFGAGVESGQLGDILPAYGRLAQLASAPQ